MFLLYVLFDIFVGRDQFGVFPLKGKLLNVREASLRHARDNVEFTGRHFSFWKHFLEFYIRVY